MAKFTANPQRVDPYRNFKFRVKVDNVYVARLEQVQRTEENHGKGGLV